MRRVSVIRSNSKIMVVDMVYNRGWFKESFRHALAARGIRTNKYYATRRRGGKAVQLRRMREGAAQPAKQFKPSAELGPDGEFKVKQMDTIAKAREFAARGLSPEDRKKFFELQAETKELRADVQERIRKAGEITEVPITEDFDQSGQQGLITQKKIGGFAVGAVAFAKDVEDLKKQRDDLKDRIDAFEGTNISDEEMEMLQLELTKVNSLLSRAKDASAEMRERVGTGPQKKAISKNVETQDELLGIQRSVSPVRALTDKQVEELLSEDDDALLKAKSLRGSNRELVESISDKLSELQGGGADLTQIAATGDRERLANILSERGFLKKTADKLRKEGVPEAEIMIAVTNEANRELGGVFEDVSKIANNNARFNQLVTPFAKEKGSGFLGERDPGSQQFRSRFSDKIVRTKSGEFKKKKGDMEKFVEDVEKTASTGQRKGGVASAYSPGPSGDDLQSERVFSVDGKFLKKAETRTGATAGSVGFTKGGAPRKPFDIGRDKIGDAQRRADTQKRLRVAQENLVKDFEQTQKSLPKGQQLELPAETSAALEAIRDRARPNVGSSIVGGQKIVPIQTPPKMSERDRALLKNLRKSLKPYKGER